MQLRKLLSKLTPKFADPNEEQEYAQLRIPVADSFFSVMSQSSSLFSLLLKFVLPLC